MIGWRDWFSQVMIKNSGSEIMNILRLACPFIRALHKKRVAQFNKAVRAMEQTFSRVNEAGKASVKEALLSTICLLRLSLFSAALPVIIAFLVIAILFNGSFLSPGIDLGNYGMGITVFTAFVGLALSFLLIFLTHPLHLLFSIRLPVLAAIHSLLSAIIMSQFGVLFTTMLNIENIYAPSQIFLKVLVIYAVANFYFLSQFSELINFRTYVWRHKTDGLFTIIPPEKRGQLVSFTAQDHYVEIVTINGKHLHRMSMNEAVAMASETRGVRVHRSHWVAFEAMHALEKTAERFMLKLRDGRQIPVAKSKVEQVQAYLETT